MAATTAMTVATLAATAISTGIGVYSSIQQGKAQQAAAEAQANAAARQAEYQKNIAEKNAGLAEQQASAERMQGYEDAQAKRLQTARLIGQQRAQAGASGAAVDFGSFEDVAEDTASGGEFDALNLYNQGIDKAYNSEIQAWNYRNQAGGYGVQADVYRQQADMAGAMSGVNTLSAIGQGIGGIANMGSTWAQFDAKYGDHTSGKGFTINSQKMDLGRFGRG